MTRFVWLDTFLDKQVKAGVYPTKQEAESQLMVTLIQRDIDDKVKKGRADYKAWRYRIMTDQSNSEFVKRLQEKQQNNHSS